MSHRRHRPARNWGARLHEITWFGLRAVVLENELLRVTVLADKGGDVAEFCYKRRDMDFVWLAPDGIRNPRDVAGGASDNVAAFLDHYEGGWQEVLPNGGLPSTHRGAALAQHGEVAGLPWDVEIVTDEPGEIAVRLSVRSRRMPLRVTKTFRLVSGRPELLIDEELANESGVPLEVMWGHHIVFGAPFLLPGHQIRLPAAVEADPAVAEKALTVVPDYGEPSDVHYLTGFGPDGWYEITDPVDGLGLRVAWDATVLKHLWVWRELGASRDHPWWGRAYVVGLEPFAGYPTEGLAEAVRNGSALTLQPHETRSLWLRASVLEERN
ncbi:DUF4432 family protein [Spirillospora sp. NPDC048911]|uniref:DUF4432 family protein n=1 Tax=Spirillospora sp. NPDC048911 TaxID=3364527 RepID=UPI0037160DFF